MGIVMVAFSLLILSHGIATNNLHEETVMKKSKPMKIDEIKTHPDLSSLSKIDEERVVEIQQDIETNGYDHSQPIAVWRSYIGDGHHRYEAAKRAGLKEITVYELDFDDVYEVLVYAVVRNRLRRQWTDADRFAAIMLLDRKAKRGRKPKGSPEAGEKPKNTSKETAEIVGASKNTVSKVRSIIAHGDAELIEAVRIGDTKISAAYKIVREAAEEAEEGTENEEEKKDGEDKQDEQEDTEGQDDASDDSADSGDNDDAADDEEDDDTPLFYGADDDCEWAALEWHVLSDTDAGPEFLPEELQAPQNSGEPESTSTRDCNVIVSPNVDLFGNGVRQEWIDQILKTIEENPAWNFIIPTKTPERLVDISFPLNSWVGAEVQTLEQATSAIQAFKKMTAKGTRPPVLFLVFDPPKEQILFQPDELKAADWIIIGAGEGDNGKPPTQPDWSVVESLFMQARAAGCEVNFKPNLTVRPAEVPEIAVPPRDKGGKRPTAAKPRTSKGDKAEPHIMPAARPISAVAGYGGLCAFDQYFCELKQCDACRGEGLLFQNPDDKRWAYPILHPCPNPKAEILIVAEAPNYSATFDKDKGFLTVGPYGDSAGKLMDELLESVELEYETDVLHINTVQCLPARDSKGNYPVTPAQVKNCSGWLKRSIEIVKPKLVVTFGGAALDGLKLIEDHNFTLGEHVGTIVSWASRQLLPLFHPSGRGGGQRSEKQQFADIAVLKSWLAGEVERHEVWAENKKDNKNMSAAVSKFAVRRT